jgi:hypothetical protein
LTALRGRHTIEPVIRLGTAVVVALAVCAPGASAATRYAEPNGDGPPGTCPQSDPCAIRAAISDPSVAPGDEVVVAPGTYDITPGPPLSISNAISVHGQAGQPRPLFTVQPGTSAVIRISNARAVLSDVNLSRASGLFLLAVDQGLAERVSATSGGSYACTIGVGTIRDSVCSATGGGVAVAAGSVGGGSGTFTADLVNVTARARGSAGSYAVQASSGVGSQTTLRARNVIADGDAADTFASASGAGSPATVTMVSSNFDSASTSGVGSAVTPAGSGDNQTAPPLLADPAGGDFHQLPGSPTIDAGTPDALLGAFDLDGQARVDGSAPDIGADEVQTAPETTISKGPKAKVKTRKKKAKVKFAFESSEPGSTFACALDAAAAAACSSPHYFKVRKGRHSLTVTATDAAGNVDPTPATYSWKVKRKRRKR